MHGKGVVKRAALVDNTASFKGSSGLLGQNNHQYFLVIMNDTYIVEELGTVEYYNLNLGYGFLVAEDGEKYFFHGSCIEGKVHRSVRPNQKVKFIPSRNEKGLYAHKVTVVW